MNGSLLVAMISLTGGEEIDGDEMLIRLQDRELDGPLFISRAQFCGDT